MFLTYNMGIGFCVVVAPEDADAVRRIAHDYGVESHVIGRTVSDPKKQVRIPQYRLIGTGGKFRRVDGE
jgi:phosphoribosylformylglycinamidine cyclo-ligase